MLFLDPVTCLAAALYFEARSEDIPHQLMVASTIMNRVESRRFPDTVCGVVKQKHQFSFYWDGVKEVIHEPEAYERSIYWAQEVLSKNISFHKGCHYAGHDVSRTWMDGMTREVHGYHAFYEGGC